jgi:hypothetical protein
MKSKKYIGGSILLLFILVFLINITGIDSNAAELRDYRLPSQMSIQSSKHSPELIIPTDTVALPSDADVYVKFKQDVINLSPQDRGKLKDGFEKKVAQTSSETEKAYYYHLIAILYECGIK